MVRGVYKDFKTVVNELSESLPIMVESVSEVYCLIPEPRKFAEVTRLSVEIRKYWLKETLKDINNLIKNPNFLVNEPEKRYHVTPCMYVYKAKLQSDGSHDKLKLIIVVRANLQNKYLS